jgi:hypothetical protein
MRSADLIVSIVVIFASVLGFMRMPAQAHLVSQITAIERADIDGCQDCHMQGEQGGMTSCQVSCTGIPAALPSAVAILPLPMLLAARVALGKPWRRRTGADTPPRSPPTSTCPSRLTGRPPVKAHILCRDA